jgi:hypothetical protein
MMDIILLVHLFHIIIVGSLFLYVGIKREKIPQMMYPFLLGLGIFIILYHIYKASNSKTPWINYIHIFLIGPLLVYIGYMNKETSRKYYEILLMFGFAAIGYHGYYMIKGDH